MQCPIATDAFRFPAIFYRLAVAMTSSHRSRDYFLRTAMTVTAQNTIRAFAAIVQ